MPDWLNPRDLSLAPLDWIRCGNTFLPIPMVPVPIPKGQLCRSGAAVCACVNARHPLGIFCLARAIGL